ncbi:MAG TPA: hypothetical protein VN442_19540 [Bryobacteraceae bacterium]|nr:hypothetical protein [Bryobacteraceae bacterium]
MRQAYPFSDPVGSAAVELLATRASGGERFTAALDRAAVVCRDCPVPDAAGDERRELLEGIVEELRAAPLAGCDRLWAGLLAHLAYTPVPSSALY